MDEFKVTILAEPTLIKPKTEQEKLQWANALGSAKTIDLTIEELAKAAGEWGYSFCHAVFDNQWIHRDNFQYAQLIVVDVDKNLSPQQALDRSKELGLPMPNIIYLTLSDLTDSTFSKKQKLRQAKKFRMIYVLDKPINDLSIYELLLKQGMYLIFPESDHVGATQKWLGGKEVIFLNTETRLSTLDLMCCADVYNSRNINTPQGRKKQYKKKYEKLPPNIFHDGCWDGGDEGIVSNSANSLSIYKEIEKNETIRGFDWAAARLEFKLLDDFLGCKMKIYNPELLGLFSAMRRIEGGVKLWKKSIQENLNIKNYHLAIADWYNTVVARGGNPWEKLIKDYAPNDPVGEEYDRLTDIHFKRGQKAIKLKNIKEIKIEEAHMKMQTFIKKFLDSNDMKFAVCKAATALGKSKFILENVNSGCLICVPTHDLAIQHADDLEKLRIEYLVAPDVPDLPEPIQKELDNYRSASDNIGAARFLKRMSIAIKSQYYGLSANEAQKLEQLLTRYFDELKKCVDSNLPVIITHKRLMFTEFPNHDTVIIDEDIVPTLFETGSFNTKDLRLLISTLRRSNYSGCEKDIAVLEWMLEDIKLDSQLFRHVQSTSCGRSEIFEDFKEIIDCVHRLGSKLIGQILPFFSCDQYIVDFEDENDMDEERVVNYLIRHELPQDKKILVLSATANKYIYEKINSEVQWLDISHVEHKGNRIQFSNLSHSRSTIGSFNNRKSLNLIKKYIDDTPVITFMKFRHLFEYAADVYLENCSGFNDYKGKDIAVVGTPHIPTHVYRLIAAALDIEFTANDFNLEPQWVKYNGYKFKFMTYAHEGLQNIQFYFIESALVQACGRNRSLREDCTVHLFSNFPLAGFEQYSTKDLESRNEDFTKLETEIIQLSIPSGSIAS